MKRRAAGWDLDGYVNSDSTLWSYTDDLDLAMHGCEDLLNVDPLLGPLMVLAGSGIGRTRTHAIIGLGHRSYGRAPRRAARERKRAAPSFAAPPRLPPAGT